MVVVFLSFKIFSHCQQFSLANKNVPLQNRSSLLILYTERMRLRCSEGFCRAGGGGRGGRGLGNPPQENFEV